MAKKTKRYGYEGKNLTKSQLKKALKKSNEKEFDNIVARTMFYIWLYPAYTLSKPFDFIWLVVLNPAVQIIYIVMLIVLILLANK